MNSFSWGLRSSKQLRRCQIFQCFPKITDKIKELRDKLNVRVISTTDLLKFAATTADSLAIEMVLTTSNFAMTAEINEQDSRTSKRLHDDETNNEAL